MVGRPWLEEIIAFLTQIGIEVRARPGVEGFLQGVTLERGAVVFDPQRLLWPGDLLHEAGHLAVTAETQRPGLVAVDADPGLEMAAIAWSWAALKHANIPPEVVFHDQGYRGASRSIIEAFETTPGFGVPILEWLEMTRTGSRARAAGVPSFPHMIRWLRG